MTLSEFIDGFIKSEYFNKYIKNEAEKRRNEKGEYVGWSGNEVIITRDELQNKLIEIYDSYIDIDEDITEEIAEDIYEQILEEQA